MTARKYDIEIEQGATFVMALTYKDAAGATVDLTTYAAEMQVREAAGKPILASASSANGRITLGALGQILIKIPFAETKAMIAPRGVYDFFLHDVVGQTRDKLLYGDVALVPAITK